MLSARVVARVLVACSAAAALAGCASSTWTWVQEGANADQLAADLRECQSKAEASVPDDSSYDENPSYAEQQIQWRREGEVQACMKAKGWRRVEVQEASGK